MLGISRSYVSRIEKRALKKLFNQLNASKNWITSFSTCYFLSTPLTGAIFMQKSFKFK
jgi:hypothetical protein